MSTQPYSGTNPIPKISDFLRETAELEEAPEGDARGTDTVGRRRAGLCGRASVGGNRRTVTDPTTGNEVTIEDANREFVEEARRDNVVVPNANLPDRKEGGEVRYSFLIMVVRWIMANSTQEIHSSPTQSREEYARTQDVTAPPDPVVPGSTTDVPIHGEKTNILFHPTPALSLRGTVFRSFERRAITPCVILFASIVFFGYAIAGGSFIGLALVGAGASSYLWYWAKGLADESTNVDWESERRRGEIATANLIPESVEWMNKLLGLGWGLVDPDMFNSMADILEDVMQASVPGVIENVRVADISQGSNPLRILSLRALPEADVRDLKRTATAAGAGRDDQEKLAEEEGGEVYNLEASFAYHAAPTRGRGVSNKVKNMHLQVEFYVGAKGFFGVPLRMYPSSDCRVWDDRN